MEAAGRYPRKGDSQEKLGTVPQSMSQYTRLIGGYRLPRPGIDTLQCQVLAVVVLYAGRIYKVPVYEADRPLSVGELYQLLCQVMELDCSQPRAEHAPVGLMTSLERDSWCSAREELLRHSSVSASSVRASESPHRASSTH